jgi:hypothetical protein
MFPQGPPKKCPGLMSHGGANVPGLPPGDLFRSLPKSDLLAFVVTCAPNSSLLDVSQDRSAVVTFRYEWFRLATSTSVCELRGLIE